MMLPAASVLTDLSKAATGSLVAAVWQGLLMAGAAAIGLKLLPKTPAAVRFAIWFGVFLLLTVLPIVALWPGHPASVVAASGSGHSAWLVLDERWCVAIATLWALASLIRAFTLLVAAFRVRALWTRATPLSTEIWAGSDAHSDACKEPRRAQVCVSNEVDRPTVIGFLSPKILIPAWLLEKLTPAELEQVVLHEAGHLRRADDWMNLIQKIALVLFPLNPVLAWVERRLCFERELAVDERVLQAFGGKTGAATAYAECLANLAEYRLERRGFALMLVIGLLGRQSELGKRIVRLLEHREPMRPAQARLLMGGAMLVLLTAATGLEHCPQLVGFSAAQPIGSREPATEVAAARHLVTPRSPLRAVDLRATVATGQEWKTTGDASPQLAKSPETKLIHALAHPVHKLRKTTHGAVAVEARQPGIPQPDQMVETVSSARQVVGDGQVVIMRWVTVTSVGQQKTRAVQTIQKSRTDFDSQQEQQPAPPVPSYAAVPVQGGWLVFQL